MADDALFDIEATPTPEPMSADRRRTVRQKQCVDLGGHPLGLVITGIRRHPETLDKAYTTGDPKDRELTCGTCVHRASWGWMEGRGYPKCMKDGTRISHGASTDIRAWWPACVDHEVAPDA